MQHMHNADSDVQHVLVNSAALRANQRTSFHHVMQAQYKHTGSLASHLVSLSMSTSSRTPGRPVAEHGEESEAVVAQRLHTGCLSPSSLDLAPLKVRDDMRTGT